jgi:molybdenum cofactor cytidylyltransferase
VILAAGGSSRFGGPKQLLEFDGENIVHRCARFARAVRLDPVFVVVGEHAHHIGEIPGATLVMNSQWKTGQASSLRAGLEHAIKAGSDAVLVMLADQPNVDAAALKRLIDRYDSSHDIVAASYSGTIGAPAILGAKHFGKLLELTGDEGAGKWMRERLDRVTAVPMHEAATDIDTPNDLDRLSNE